MYGCEQFSLGDFYSLRLRERREILRRAEETYSGDLRIYFEINRYLQAIEDAHKAARESELVFGVECA